MGKFLASERSGWWDSDYGVAFSPGGQILAVGGKDGTVRLWDVASHTLIGHSLRGHSKAVRSVVFSPDGSGTIWTDEVTYYTFEENNIYLGGMNDMDLIAPNTVMVATYTVIGDEKRGVGIPITVKKVHKSP